MQRVQFSSGGRYPVLRAIAIIYLFLGGIAVIGGVLAVLWLLIRAPFSTMTDRIILAAAALAGSVFAGALMLGAAEVIKLFVDLEHNTRMASLDRPTAPLSGPTPAGGLTNRISVLEEETAEAALIRGH
ncbi:MAG: hypothetical protein ABSC42_03250 [Tepidisphaeraceae bacterium]|jgi:hypothetical protein